MGLATQSECSSSQLCVVWVPWRSCHPHTFRWLTVDELRREVEHETSKAAAVEQWTRLQPMPVYLLQRQPESPAGSGCVWCISGALRGLVAAEELMPRGPMLWKVSPSVFRCASTACRCALLPKRVFCRAVGSGERLAGQHVYSARVGSAQRACARA